MNIRLETAWVVADPQGYDNSDGKLQIEGVGCQTIRCRLPEPIIKQIEQFYVGEYQRRMEGVK